MCKLCTEVLKLWPKGDVDLTMEGWEELFRLAETIQAIPGGHLIGAGLTRSTAGAARPATGPGDGDVE